MSKKHNADYERNRAKKQLRNKAKRKKKIFKLNAPSNRKDVIKKVKDSDYRQIVSGEGLEAITDSLIQELVTKGWSEESLEWHQKNNSKYSRPRDSIMEPPVKC
jgi:hypothetical protein